MRLAVDKMDSLDAKTCFICGNYLLNNTPSDLAYVPVHTGRAVRAKPDKYFLFTCPNCSKTGHKRCWYNVGENKIKKGWFKKPEWQLSCPSCGFVISPKRIDRVDWKQGYQIWDHPDEELIELHTGDVLTWKAGSVFSKIGKAINDFFRAVGIGSLSESETNAIAAAAGKVGKTIQEIAENVFKLEIPAERRSEITELKCQNCAAPLPLPGLAEEAIVCRHCGTGHLLPT